MKIKTKTIIIIFVILNGIFVGLIPVSNIDLEKENLKTSAGDWDNRITRAVGNYPMGVFIGDANNDGLNDIATANNWADTISVLCWNQTAGDWDAYTRAAGDFTRKIFIGDANNDGQNDIATANYGDHTVSIFLWNKTSDDWDAEITRTVGQYPYNVFIGDANNDGQNDIVTANSYDNTVSILCWNHTSSDWDMQITQAVGDSPNGIFIGDANNDGQNDIVASCIMDDTVSILCWNHSSNSWDTYTRTVGDLPYDVFIGDANNDGQNDIATANDGSHSVSILCWNQTAGDWDAKINLAAGGSPISIFIGDANNNGQNDIVVTNSNENTISIIYWNQAAEDWDMRFTRSCGDRPLDIFIGDANNDGQNDLVTANAYDDTVSIFCWNQPEGDWDSQVIRTVGNNPTSVFIGDANNDGENDIVVANKNDNTISILCWNHTNNDWDPQVIRTVGDNPISVFIGDANNDGENDIVVANKNGNTISILCWNHTNNDWDPQVIRIVGDNPTSVFVGDANNDGENDIVVANEQDNNTSILLWNYTINNWDPEVKRAVGINPTSVFVGDANNDGENDIVIANNNDNTTSILCWNYTNNDWDSQIIQPIGDNPTSVFVGDVNNDGENDIVVANNNDNTTSILCWNHTTGNWNPEVTQAVGGNPTGVYVGDANNDGQNDIVISNGIDNTISIIFSYLGTPKLDTISPSTDNDGEIYLNWNNVDRATIYHIYRNDSYITSVDSLIPIASVSDSNYTDILLTNGTYFYVVIAGDNLLNSTISNCENVTVVLALDPPILDPISPSIDNDGIVNLTWYGKGEISKFFIYRNDSYIISVESLIPIASTSESSYTDTLLDYGTYFYAVVAGNKVVNSSISNCENVTVVFPLDPPILDPILPSIDNDGIIHLDWNDVNRATVYHIYKNDSYINSVDNLVPIASISDSNYTDTLPTNGTYFYVIVAGNIYINSSISNCENVLFTLDPPILDPISPSIDNDGTIYLDWNDVGGATIYHIYRSDLYITSVDGLIPIASASDSNYTDTLPTNGTYFYVVMAGNAIINSSISNCEDVLFTLDPPMLDPILPSIDFDGIIYLEWNDVGGATIYYIYRSDLYITSVDGLIPIASISESNYTDTLPTYGLYFYVVVAGNAIINSSISNCNNVTFALEAPILDPISPSIDNDGIVNLTWNDISGAIIYYIYRSDLYITSVDGLIPIASISESNYIDTLPTNGTYFYVVVAGNAFTNSSISNCNNVTFALEAPILDPISPSIDNDGIVNLTWNDVGGATIYHIYRSDSYITSVDGLIPIASTSESNYTDTLPTNGTYFYVVMAGNAIINSSISNCENVLFTLDSPMLDPILPSIDNDGIVNLTWNDIIGAIIYYIYRSDSYITSVDGLIPIASASESNYTDTLPAYGLYFYVVVAGNAITNSSISNCENVLFTLDSPMLDPILPSINYDGIVNLTWNDISGATIYYIYRSDSYITSVDSLIPIASASESNYTDILPTNGTYFYVVVAGNAFTNSSISNCENVEVIIEYDSGDDRDNNGETTKRDPFLILFIISIATIGGIGLCATIIFLMKKSKRKIKV